MSMQGRLFREWGTWMCAAYLSGWFQNRTLTALPRVQRHQALAACGALSAHSFGAGAETNRFMTGANPPSTLPVWLALTTPWPE